jgi:hypothetical protein
MDDINIFYVHLANFGMFWYIVLRKIWQPWTRPRFFKQNKKDVLNLAFSVRKSAHAGVPERVATVPGISGHDGFQRQVLESRLMHVPTYNRRKCAES